METKLIIKREWLETAKMMLTTKKSKKEYLHFLELLADICMNAELDPNDTSKAMRGIRAMNIEEEVKADAARRMKQHQARNKSVFFIPIFKDMDALKEKMRNCTTKEQWQELRNEYKQFLTTAKAVYLEYSNESKFNTFLERENVAVAAIYTNVKQLWESRGHTAKRKKSANPTPKLSL